MMTLTPPQKNGKNSVNPAEPKSVNPAEPWLQLSLQKFFSGINWEDNPPEVQEIKLTSQDTSGPLHLALSTSQFFAAINWEGTTIAAPTSVQSQASPATSKGTDLTLDDFSNLF